MTVDIHTCTCCVHVIFFMYHISLRLFVAVLLRRGAVDDLQCVSRGRRHAGAVPRTVGSADSAGAAGLCSKRRR